MLEIFFSSFMLFGAVYHQKLGIENTKKGLKKNSRMIEIVNMYIKKKRCQGTAHF